MKKKGMILLLGCLVVVGGWLMTSCGAPAQPSEGVVDLWVTWGDEADQLQSLFDRFSQSSGISVSVTTRVGTEELEEALAGSEQPDLVILSSADLVASYYAQGLVEPLDRWIEAGGIDTEDIYPASLGQCQSLEGGVHCLPWGSDLEALFWNKDLFAAADLDPDRPPQTMEELVEFAKKLTVRDEKGELSQVGFIPDLAQTHTDLFVHRFGGALYNAEGTEGAELAADSQPVVDALNWQKQFYNGHAADELKEFISSFTPYMTSRHAMYAGRRLDCRQCHRSAPIQNGKTPGAGFDQGRIAMMIDGQWRAGLGAGSGEEPSVNYGVVPFPSLSAYPERASGAVVRGPVVFIPTGAMDMEGAASLLAWMMSPEVVAEAAMANSLLPTSRTASQDRRFQQVPSFKVFMDLLAQPEAEPTAPIPISRELNETLGQAEEELLHRGGDTLPVLNEVQAQLAPKLKEALGD